MVLFKWSFVVCCLLFSAVITVKALKFKFIRGQKTKSGTQSEGGASLQPSNPHPYLQFAGKGKPIYEEIHDSNQAANLLPAGQDETAQPIYEEIHNSNQAANHLPSEPHSLHVLARRDETGQHLHEPQGRGSLHNLEKKLDQFMQWLKQSQLRLMKFLAAQQYQFMLNFLEELENKLKAPTDSANVHQDSSKSSQQRRERQDPDMHRTIKQFDHKQEASAKDKTQEQSNNPPQKRRREDSGSANSYQESAEHFYHTLEKTTGQKRLDPTDAHWVSSHHPRAASGNNEPKVRSRRNSHPPRESTGQPEIGTPVKTTKKAIASLQKMKGTY